MQTDLISVYVSIAPRPSSRPMLEVFRPPQGRPGSTRLGALNQTLPAPRASIARQRPAQAWGQTLAPSPASG